jgi:integrase
MCPQGYRSGVAQGKATVGERSATQEGEEDMSDKREKKKIRGVFEKVPGSGIWWIQYFDAERRRRREIAGARGNAIDLVRKRKNEALAGKKLPEKLRGRVVRFEELTAAAEAYCKANNQGQQFDLYRIGRFKAEFGNRLALIPIEDLRRWFDEQDWEDATYNRYKTTLSLIYRLAMENGKVASNPAKLLKHKREDNGRVRFLGQFAPLRTKLEYLKGFSDEESRLRAVILKNYPEHLPEFEIALQTGMRPSEQYGLVWSRVDLTRKLLTIPKTKNGRTRHLPLNSVAMGAFKVLRQRSLDPAGPVFVNIEGEPLRGYKHWFDPAVAEAGVREFTWYCLRHTFASRLVMSGVDLRTVAELLGHKTIQMTMRYAHLAPAHQLAAVERLASFEVAPVQTEESREPTEPSATISATEPEAEPFEKSAAVN